MFLRTKLVRGYTPIPAAARVRDVERIRKPYMNSVSFTWKWTVFVGLACSVTQDSLVTLPVLQLENRMLPCVVLFVWTRIGFGVSRPAYIDRLLAGFSGLVLQRMGLVAGRLNQLAPLCWERADRRREKSTSDTEYKRSASTPLTEI